MFTGEYRLAVNDTAKVASYKTPAIDKGVTRNFSLHAKWTETGISGASIKIQGSNVNDDAWFQDVPGSSQNITGDAGWLWNLTDQYYKFVRFAITIGGGTLDTLQVYYGVIDS